MASSTAPVYHPLLLPFAFDDEGRATESSTKQIEVECECSQWLSLPTVCRGMAEKKGVATSENVPPLIDPSTFEPLLMREEHCAFLSRCLRTPLSLSYMAMDASRGWTFFWALQGLDLMGAFDPDASTGEGGRIPLRSLVSPRPPSSSSSSSSKGDAEAGTSAQEEGKRALFLNIIDTLLRFQSANGGFGGGIGQLPHLLSNYATTMAFLIIAGQLNSKEEKEHWYRRIDRVAMLRFLVACKEDQGVSKAFRVTQDGEIDVRGCYAALAVASALNLVTEPLVDGVGEFLLSCQTFEGGFGGEPGGIEAHGGYTYCALAGLALIDEWRRKTTTNAVPPSLLSRVRLADLQRWLLLRQCSLEGGFSGRTNKLVDGCYTFWQGASFAVLERFLSGSGRDGDAGISIDSPLPYFDRKKLDSYVLLCCQQPDGGLRDKPSTNRDHYHSCYTLSGLSVSQHCGASVTVAGAGVGAGAGINAVKKTDPLFNVREDRLEAATSFFGSLAVPSMPPASSTSNAMTAAMAVDA